MVYIPLLMDNSSTYIVATKAFYTPKLPYKLLLESAFKKCKQLYIRPNKEIGGHTIQRHFNNLVVGKATYKNSLYVVQLALIPQYITHASIQQLNINILHQELSYICKDILQKIAKIGDFSVTGTLAQYKAYHLATIKY